MSALKNLRTAVAARLALINGSSPYTTAPTVRHGYPFRPDQRVPVPAVFYRRSGWTSSREGIAMTRRGRSVTFSVWAYGTDVDELDDLITDLTTALEATPDQYGAITGLRMTDAPTLTEGDDFVLDDETRARAPEGIAIQVTFPCDSARGAL